MQKLFISGRNLTRATRTSFTRALSTVTRRSAYSQAVAEKTPDLPPVHVPAGVQTLKISTDSQTNLLSVLKGLPSPYEHPSSHCKAAYAAVSTLLPPRVLSDIRNFHASPHAPGALVISGLPRDPDLASTPLDGNRSQQKRTYVSEGCLTGIGMLIGKPFSISSEKGGDMVHNVCPVKGSETVQSNESSDVELSLHVENAYFDNRPDYLALYGLRQDHEKRAFTTFVDFRLIISQMEPSERAELEKPAFVVPSPPSHHKAMGGEKWSTARPLVGSLGNPDLICHFPGMKAITPQAHAALNKFEMLARLVENINYIALEPGNLLLLNNHKVAHGRTQFKPRYDGTDRWLQRVYVKS